MLAAMNEQNPSYAGRSPEEMERLPESFRAPLVVHYFQGLSTETIALRWAAAAAPCFPAWLGREPG